MYFFLSEETLGCKAAAQSEERGIKIKGREEEEEKQFPVLIVSLVQIAFWKSGRPKQVCSLGRAASRTGPEAVLRAHSLRMIVILSLLPLPLWSICLREIGKPVA